MRTETLTPAPMGEATALGGLLASSGCFSKRDLAGRFNRIRIAGPAAAAFWLRVRSSRRPYFPALF
jgi:hypothetical protein